MYVEISRWWSCAQGELVIKTQLHAGGLLSRIMNACISVQSLLFQQSYALLLSASHSFRISSRQNKTLLDITHLPTLLKTVIKMFSPILLVTGFAALIAAAPLASQTPAEPRGLLSGQLTWYTEGMGVSATACGTVHQVTEVNLPPPPPSLHHLF